MASIQKCQKCVRRAYGIKRCSQFYHHKDNYKCVGLKKPKPKLKPKKETIPKEIVIGDIIEIPKRENKEWSPFITRGEMYQQENFDPYPKLLKEKVEDKVNDYINKFNQKYNCMFIIKEMLSSSDSDVTHFLMRIEVIEQFEEVITKIYVIQGDGVETKFESFVIKKAEIKYNSQYANLTFISDKGRLTFEWSNTLLVDMLKQKINPNIIRKKYINAVVYQIYRHSPDNQYLFKNLDRLLSRMHTKEFDGNWNKMKNKHQATLEIIERTNARLKRSTVLKSTIQIIENELVEARKILKEKEEKARLRQAKARRERARKAREAKRIYEECEDYDKEGEAHCDDDDYDSSVDEGEQLPVDICGKPIYKWLKRADWDRLQKLYDYAEDYFPEKSRKYKGDWVHKEFQKWAHLKRYSQYKSAGGK